MKHFKQKYVPGVCALLAVALTACGGGGGGTASSSSSSYDIASASGATATAVGLAAISADSTDTTALAGANSAVDMTAAVGDTWRLVYNSTNNAFKLRAFSSSYGLSGYSDQGTLTKSVSGTIETYSGNFGTSNTANSGSVAIKLDTRTKSVIGSITWRDGSNTAITSDVTGTTVAPSSTSVSGLAGDYVFANQARNQSDGLDKNSAAGTLNVSSSGLVSVCPGLKYTAGVCKKLDGSTPTDGSQNPITSQLASTAGQPLALTASGTKTLTFPAGVSSVKVHVQAGDLGPVLVIDQDWLNDSSVRRTGIFVAARIASIDPAKFAGTFYCPTVQIGSEPVGATITATSTSFSAQKNTSSSSATVALNKVYDVGSSVERDFAGGFHITSTGVSPTLHQFGFALSSSLFVFQNGDASRLNFCQRT